MNETKAADLSDCKGTTEFGSKNEKEELGEKSTPFILRKVQLYAIQVQRFCFVVRPSMSLLLFLLSTVYLATVFLSLSDEFLSQ